MKKVKLIIAAVAMLSLVSSSAVYADGFAPGEGLYIGGFAGVGSGMVQPKVVATGEAFGTSATNDGTKPGGTFEVNDGGIGLEGIEGGVTVGYGYRMGDVYAGLEGEHATGDVKFKLSSASAIQLSLGQTLQTIEATKEWTSGGFGRLGFYLNKDTLLAFRGGVLISKFDVKTTGSTNYSESFYGGGPSFGASLESSVTAIDPNLSVRIGAVYTNFLTANVFGIGGNNAANVANQSGHDSEVTGSALSARVGLQYSFFDVNSLF